MLLLAGLRGGLWNTQARPLQPGIGVGGGDNLLTDPSRASTSTSSEFASPCGT